MGAGKKLAEWRRSREFSQEAAATAVGVSQPAWSAWEAGVAEPGIELAFKIEEVTEGFVTVRELAVSRPKKKRSKLRARQVRKAAA